VACFALTCALVLPGRVCAADQPQHELDEKTSADLDKLKPLLDAKNWDAALALLETIRVRVGADSYDMAIVTDVEAKIYLQKGEYQKAIPPLETALRLGDAHQYFSLSSIQDQVQFLAQIYYQEATTTKVPALQKQNFAKSIAYWRRWIANTDKPDRDPQRQEAQLYYANVLYNEAAINPEKVDTDLLHQAQEAVEQGLRMSPHPKDTFYVILLAITQQENNYPKLAEILELLVKMSPGKKDYWSQLAGIYLNLAASEKNEKRAKEYNTRAILAIERAQSLGFMKTPKENYTLVGLYYNVGQFGRATEILHTGLRDGSIESDEKNWELLISSYQQVDRPFQAIEAAKEGAKKFPHTGQLDYQAATIYYSLNKTEDSYKSLQAAVAKGHFEKPGAVYGFLAYVSWELGKYPEALDAVNKALDSPDAKKDAQLPKLKKAIEDAIHERETAKAAKTA